MREESDDGPALARSGVLLNVPPLHVRDPSKLALNRIEGIVDGGRIGLHFASLRSILGKDRVAAEALVSRHAAQCKAEAERDRRNEGLNVHAGCPVANDELGLRVPGAQRFPRRYVIRHNLRLCCNFDGAE